MSTITNIFEWLNLWLSIPLTVVGFAAAIRQATKARTASELAKEAAQRAEALLSKNQLILLIPILHRAEGDLETALEHGERRLVEYHLSSWRWHSSQFRSYLTDSAADKKLAKSVQASIALAAETKLRLGESESDMGKICIPVREAIAAVTGELGRLAADETSRTG